MKGQRGVPVKLTVHKLDYDEVYQDFAKIPSGYRKDKKGKLLGAGVICSIRCVETGRSTFVILRNSSKTGPAIGIDHRVRKHLGVHSDREYNFDLSQVGFTGQFRWAMAASDIRYSIPAKIAMFSLALGFLSVLLGILALVKTCGK